MRHHRRRDGWRPSVDDTEYRLRGEFGNPNRILPDPRVETFYWTAILASNTLGTALGDYLADSSGLGYGFSNLLIAGGIAMIGLAYFFTPVSRTTLFWAAFVLTRPFGATMGDLLTKAPAMGGMGFGTMGSTLVLLSILVVLIAITMRRDRSPRTT